MARLRRVTSKYCIRCRANLDDPATTLHRMEHRRADRRRAQWRDAKQRKARREGAVGYLHDLSCPGGHYAPRNGCRPIPMFAEPQENVA